MWQWLTTHAMTLATLVTAGATLALVFITAWYAYLTGRLVKETQAARAPTLFVDLEFDSHVAKLVIGNVGDSGAHDLRFTVKDSMPLRDPRPSDGIQEVAAIKRGVSYLAPRRRLKFWLGLVDWDRLKQTGGSLDVAIHYRDHQRKLQTTSFVIDLSAYQGVLANTFSDPLHAIAAAIRDTSMHRKSDKSINTFVAKMFKRECPTCGERIALKAKKCRYCHEAVPPSESPTSEASS